MAENTSPALRNALIYSVYVRNHTPEGTFRALEADLTRIRALGTDILWLMPIHPIGEEGHKGTLGCPYANRDYRAVNPAYGTMADFCHLVEATHAAGMKLIIDVVYNHTSPDSTLRYAHPEYFYHRADGSFGNRFGDWSDVIDLDYNQEGLWAEQISNLCYWAQYVDGFRCDVASLVPAAFWRAARAACEQVKPGLIWLAESVHTRFNFAARRAGLNVSTDAEAFTAFDMEYDYDIREILDGYWAGQFRLHEYLQALNFQEVIYPINYIKMRCLENHDQPRIASRVKDARALDNWHAFLFFQKGATLLYAGEENCDANQPSLFDRDPVNWGGPDISARLRKFARVKKEYFPPDGFFHAEADDENDMVAAVYGKPGRELAGVFSLKGAAARVRVTAADGEYENLLDGKKIIVRDGQIECTGAPIVFAMWERRVDGAQGEAK